MKLLKQTSLLSTAAVFAAVSLAPAAALAADIKQSTNPGHPARPKLVKPVGFSSRDECISTLGASELKDIKLYGDQAIRPRIKDLESLDKKTAKTPPSATSVQRAITAANNNLRGVANRQTTANSGVSNTGGTTAPPTITGVTPNNSNVKINGQIKEDLTDLRGTDGKGGANKALADSKTAAEAAKVVCDAIYDTRVYSYQVNQVEFFQKFDALFNRNLLNEVAYQNGAKKAALSGLKYRLSPDPSAAVEKQLVTLNQKLGEAAFQAASGVRAEGNNNLAARKLYTDAYDAPSKAITAQIKKDSAAIKKSTSQLNKEIVAKERKDRAAEKAKKQAEAKAKAEAAKDKSVNNSGNTNAQP